VNFLKPHPFRGFALDFIPEHDNVIEKKKDDFHLIAKLKSAGILWNPL